MKTQKNIKEMKIDKSWRKFLKLNGIEIATRDKWYAEELSDVDELSRATAAAAKAKQDYIKLVEELK